MPISRRPGFQTVARVQDMKSLDSLRLGNSTDAKAYDMLRLPILLKAGNALPIMQYLKDTGSVETKGVDEMENYHYALEGTAVKHVNIVKWSAANMLRPGLNGSEITIWTKIQLFQAKDTISGPSYYHFLNILSYEGNVDGLHKYTCSVSVKKGVQPYIPGIYLSPTKNWKRNYSGSSEEFSFKGSGVSYMAPASRIGYWSGVRVSEKIGGAVAKAKVAIFDIEDETGQAGSSSFFELEVKLRLHQWHNENVTNVALFGIREADYAQQKDMETGQTIIKSDGIFTQRGAGNKFYSGDPSIELLDSYIVDKIQMDGSDDMSDNHFLVSSGFPGYNDLVAKATQYAKDRGLVININSGDKNVVGGYRVTSLVMPSYTLTIQLDNSLNHAVVGTDFYPGTRNYVSSYDWHVTSIGRTNSGASTKEYRYVNSKHNRSVVRYGMRGDGNQGSSAVNLLAPNRTAEYAVVSSMEDATEFSIASDFSFIDKNPNSSFVISRAVPGLN